ncbi:GNAT family N-acetyltransferase [Saccharibacillus sp. O16]|nr:GNAT family N-acetyltransferase [Saccharibacillus sp. O16]
MLLFEQDGIALRTLQPQDASLLLSWLTDPAVLEWYEGRDQSFDAERVQEDFYEDPGEETACILMAEGRDIGYLQFYPLEEEERELYGYGNTASVIYGMDQFIGEAGARDRGMGTRAIAAVTDYLFRERGADKIVMDPQVRNQRALRVYEKNGFVPVKLLKHREMHEGELQDCWLMEKNHV